MKHPRFTGREHTARTLALEVLLDCQRSGAFGREVLDKKLCQAGLSPADRRLATQLTYGILRRRGTLDALLRCVVSRPAPMVEAWLWEILRAGAFQLALLTHIPPHAALHETVELAAEFGRPQAKGFLNGVLRSLQKLLTDERILEPAADALPLEHGKYRKLARAVLPEPEAYPVEYVAAAFALPPWLATRWLERFSWEECLRLGFWFAGPAPLWLRINPVRTDRTTLLARLADAGILAEPGDHPQAICLKEAVAIPNVPGYAEGWFAVQDASAMNVASALAPQPGQNILDLCAAPGGKTTHLAELMANRGHIVACDVDELRLQKLTKQVNRLGIAIVETCRMHPDQDAPGGPFDAVLVDVPCSNTGVLGRRPEVRWRLRLSDFRNLVPLQTRLLLQAAGRVRPGGVVVYSTCSIEPEENRDVVQTVLQGRPDLALEADQEQLPGRPADGGYWARLRRRKG